MTGRPPFAGETVLATLMEARNQPPEPPRQINPQIDRDLELICLKCLEKDRANRYDSALALAENLEHRRTGEPVSVRPPAAATLIRLWLRQKLGAAGWTLLPGAGFALPGGLQLFLTSADGSLLARGMAYRRLRRVALALFVALLSCLIICDGVCLSGILAAGHVLRRHGRNRRALFPYFGLAIPAAFLWGWPFTQLVKFSSGAPDWGSHFGVTLIIMVLLATVVVAQLRSWPCWLVVTLHLSWVIALAARMFNVF